jgi:hypothetical protein
VREIGVRRRDHHLEPPRLGRAAELPRAQERLISLLLAPRELEQVGPPEQRLEHRLAVVPRLVDRLLCYLDHLREVALQLCQGGERPGSQRPRWQLRDDGTHQRGSTVTLEGEHVVPDRGYPATGGGLELRLEARGGLKQLAGRRQGAALGGGLGTLLDRRRDAAVRNGRARGQVARALLGIDRRLGQTPVDSPAL